MCGVDFARFQALVDTLLFSASAEERTSDDWELVNGAGGTGSGLMAAPTRLPAQYVVCMHARCHFSLALTLAHLLRA